ncbi:MAG: L,D-transpeptidase [Lachnospiraceae bacterium]|nr:L,D-transpeptidase [Lachnospiraceae bacterium]
MRTGTFLSKTQWMAGMVLMLIAVLLFPVTVSAQEGFTELQTEAPAQEGTEETQAEASTQEPVMDPLTKAYTVCYPQYDHSTYLYDEAFAQQASSFQMTYRNGFIVNYQNLFPDQGLDPATVDDQTLLQAILNILPVGLSYFDTSDGVVGFTTTGGTYVKFNKEGATDDVDYAAEAAYVLDLIRRGETTSDRLPIYQTSMADTIRNELSGTYVEVSLNAQHCWLYQNGVVTGESDIVTGTKGKTDTPQGFFDVVLMVNGKILKGEDYECWVDKWMRFTPNGNYGLHDASWRGRFGGSIYERNGSHGCVNLPTRFAYQVYDAAFVGMPVVIY